MQARLAGGNGSAGMYTDLRSSAPLQGSHSTLIFPQQCLRFPEDCEHSAMSIFLAHFDYYYIF